MVPRIIGITVTIIVTVACAGPSIPRIVDPALEPFVGQFEALLGHQVHMTVGFGDLTAEDVVFNEDVVGLCSYQQTAPYSPLITIDKQYFDNTDLGSQIELIFHELGHCELGRVHTSALDASKQPLSIMYPVNFGGSQFMINEQAYVNELFTNKVVERP